MIVVFSYIIAVLLTIALAIILYPIAALFWLLEMVGKLLVIIFDLFGKVSDNMFNFTTKVIRRLWQDIKNLDHQVVVQATISVPQWTCKCGEVNTGKFCSSCGNAMIAETVTETSERSDDVSVN